jgi:ribonuclease III
MARRKPDLAALEARIGHAFSNRDLLVNALTHMSGARGASAKSYQRLEFLGDRVLGLAIADMLYRAFPKGSEGDLSRRLSELVRRESCAAVAESWDLGSYIKIGGNESAIRRNRSVLADVCEAVIGAVFLDGGYPAARLVVERALGERLQMLAKPPSNPKALLQEWALARGEPVPIYEVVEQLGPHHAPEFRVSVAVEGLGRIAGAGPSKRAAEQDAALNLLARAGLLPRPVILRSQDGAAGAEAPADAEEVADVGSVA